jgi:hypothetical protein
VTATMMPPTTVTDLSARLAEVQRQIGQCDEAISSGVHGWAEELQDQRRALQVEAADLLGALGRDGERQALLQVLALGA